MSSKERRLRPRVAIPDKSRIGRRYRREKKEDTDQGGSTADAMFLFSIIRFLLLLQQQLLLLPLPEGTFVVLCVVMQKSTSSSMDKWSLAWCLLPQPPPCTALPTGNPIKNNIALCRIRSRRRRTANRQRGGAGDVAAQDTIRRRRCGAKVKT